MFSYIALVWNTASRAQSEVAADIVRRIQLLSPQWRTVHSQDGLSVSCRTVQGHSSEPQILPNHCGVVLGALFRNTSNGCASAKATLGAQEAQRILATEGHSLIDHFWGRYVAIISDRGTRTVRIIRDPTGRLPCATLTYRGVRIFFSHIEDIARLELMRFSINWKYIGLRTVATMMETEETGLDEVRNVLGGECVRIDGESISRSFYWHPFRIARSDVIENPAAAANSLRETVASCTAAWASCHRSVLHRLSGGLDSSIVLACLSDAPTRPDVTCLNYHSAGSDSDERTFARLMARKCGYPLIEQLRDPRTNLEVLLNTPRSAEPRHFTAFQASQLSIESTLARDRGATAIFDGNGGDGIFYEGPVLPTAGDFIHDHGLRPGLLAIALSAAYLENTSIWRVLKSALCEGFHTPEFDPLKDAYSDVKLVRTDIVQMVKQERRFVHGWFERPEDLPLGKLWQIFSMSIPMNFEDLGARAEDPEQVEPLISQPIFEVCLRIPTYVLTSGGWTRAVARRAFAGKIADEVLRRRTKGGMEQFAKDLLRYNLSFAQELLVDGMLVREGFLDRDKVKEVLSIAPNKVTAGMLELFTHLTTEVWLRSWRRPAQMAAA